jgi:hypothetical protein
VYGLGGPRILVSHPFRGISPNGELYDVYRNSINIVASLMDRGYRGTFLFLDNLPGLNFEVKRIPAWLAWFAIVAAHSDLVAIIKVRERDLSESQKGEVEFTPDRVQKKLVEIPSGELSWASQSEDLSDLEHLYVTGEPGSGWSTSREQFSEMEAAHAKPLIESYSSDDFPQDRLIVLDESGDFSFYPLDYPVYQPAKA